MNCFISGQSHASNNKTNSQHVRTIPHNASEQSRLHSEFQGTGSRTRVEGEPLVVKPPKVPRDCPSRRFKRNRFRPADDLESVYQLMHANTMKGQGQKSFIPRPPSVPKVKRQCLPSSVHVSSGLLTPRADDKVDSILQQEGRNPTVLETITELNVQEDAGSKMMKQEVTRDQLLPRIPTTPRQTKLASPKNGLLDICKKFNSNFSVF